MMRKFLSMTLAFCLLGQSGAVFAQDLGVAQSRDRAQKAVANQANPVVVGSVVAGLIAAPTVVYLVQQRRINHLKEENASLKNNLDAYKSNKELRFLQNKVSGLKKQQAINAERLANTNIEKKLLQESLEQAQVEQAALKQEIKVFEDLFKSTIDLDRYAVLCGKSVDELEAILPKLLQEDFSKNSARFTQEHLNIIKKDLIDALTIPYPESAGGLLQFLSRAPHQHASFFRNLAQHLGAKRNLVVFGLLIATGAILQDTPVNKQLLRLQQNPSLLLTLTDEEAAMLDRHPEAQMVCNVIADAYEQAVSLPQEQAEEVARYMAAANVPQISTHRLAL